MSNRRKATGLRAALAKKKVRVSSYPIPVVEYPEAEAAAKEYREAEELAGLTEFGDDDAAKEAARTRLAEAKAKLDACFYPVEFRGLGLGAFDALVNEHPPTDEQAKNGEIWNPDTFTFALIEACVIDGDGMTADDWKTELDDDTRWPRPDRAAFISAVFDANRREFSDGIPKG